MKKVKYVILGGGISGLSMAYFLNTENCIVLEKDGAVGGYCRTKIEDDYVWDYAGHFYHFKTKELERLFIDEIKPEDRILNEKKTKICLNDRMIDYPFQTHIHQLEKSDLIDCIVGLFDENGKRDEETGFLSMLYKNYGEGLVNLFLKPYNEKLYACDLNLLDKNAMGRFFPKADKEEIIFSMKKNISSSYNNTFWYPKKGAQVFIDILEKKVIEKGVEIALNKEVVDIDVKKKSVYTFNEEYQYEYLINTLPMNLFYKFTSGFDKREIDFSYNKVLVFNIGFDRGLNPDSKYYGIHWIYVPEEKYNFYRVGFYNHILHQEKLSLYIEIGFSKNEEIDTTKEFEKTIKGLKDIGILDEGNNLVAYQTIIMNPAYVHINTKTQEIITEQMELLSQMNVYSIGRYGKWTYCSMEDCMLEARTLSEEICVK